MLQKRQFRKAGEHQPEHNSELQPSKKKRNCSKASGITHVTEHSTCNEKSDLKSINEVPVKKNTNKSFSITDNVEEHPCHEKQTCLLKINLVDPIKTNVDNVDACNYKNTSGCQDLKKMSNLTLVTASKKGPSIYNLTGNTISSLYAPKYLTHTFESLPIYRKSLLPNEQDADNKELLREFIGEDLDKQTFSKLAEYCSPDNLCIGTELNLKLDTSFQGNLLTALEFRKVLACAPGACGEGNHLQTIRRLNMRLQADLPNTYSQNLKYRSIKRAPTMMLEDPPHEPLLEPGKELLYKIRIYRPFTVINRMKSSRNPIFCRDFIMLGSQRLTQLRDRITCPNDFGLRVSIPMDIKPLENAKEIFPSGFLFINNIFYNDLRSERSFDYSAPIRAWAKRRGIGDFQYKNMDAVRLDELTVRLGHPEVYVHQGNCEHLITISEVRLLGPRDQLNPRAYPFENSYSSAQVTYCNTCAELSSKWIVVGSDRVPFDPAFLCSTCYHLYFFNDKKRLGNFKAYPYISPGQRNFKM